jgi:hypothetical protein
MIGSVAEFFGGGWNETAALHLDELQIRYGVAVQITERRNKAIDGNPGS